MAANIAEIKVSMQFTTSSFLPLVLLFLCSCSTASEWLLARENADVQLYTRTKASALFEIKAVTQVSATPQAFINLLMDTNAGPEWIDNAKSIEVLASPQLNIQIVHSLLKAPWPLKDRDMITQSVTSYNPQTGIVTLVISDKNNYAPKTKNYVRMQNVMGTWTLTPFDGGTEIMYEGSGEAGGVVPTWLSNKVLVSSTYKSFLEMRKMIIKAKYKD